VTERIDHATQARTLLDRWTQPQYEFFTDGPNPRIERDQLAQAQVHATLALVEQQRVANLIALDRTLEQYTVPADDETGMDSYSSTRLRTDIREALGL
jgi:hypothetical protein